MSVDICYLISNGYGARMILHTGIVPRLQAEGLSVAVIVPEDAGESIEPFAHRHDIQVEYSPKLDQGLLNAYEKRRFYLSEDVRRHPVLRTVYQQRYATALSRKKRANMTIWLIINQLMHRLPFSRKFLNIAEKRGLANPAIAQVLQKLQPRTLVATYPASPTEASFLYEARRAGIKTVGHLLSWDNITTKGYFGIPPENYLSWGPIMTEEIREFYHVPPERIAECGVAHFDAHISAVSREKISAELRRTGLAEDKPYLFFGMSHWTLCPHEIEIVQWLAQAVRNGEFGTDMQLLIRPHPQSIQGSQQASQKWQDSLNQIAAPGIVVDYPVFATGNLEWNLDEKDMSRLANIISGCAVCLNSGSTLALEAAIHNKPVVLTAFDAGYSLPEWSSVTRFLAFPHLAKMLKFGGARVAYNFEETRTAIQHYLHDPNLDSEGRAIARHAECGPCDGLASQRIADALVDMAKSAS